MCINRPTVFLSRVTLNSVLFGTVVDLSFCNSMGPLRPVCCCCCCWRLVVVDLCACTLFVLLHCPQVIPIISGVGAVIFLSFTYVVILASGTCSLILMVSTVADAVAALALWEHTWNTPFVSCLSSPQCLPTLQRTFAFLTIACSVLTPCSVALPVLFGVGPRCPISRGRRLILRPASWS